MCEFLIRLFPPVLNCPAAIFAAFSWGWFVHPLRPTPRSLNVVSISRCGSEGGLWRRGIWFRAGIFFFLYRGTPGRKREVVGLGGVLGFPPNPLPISELTDLTRKARGGVQF